MRGLGVVVVLALTAPAGADVELRTDGFEAGDTVGFESGFGDSDIAATRFIAPDASRQLLRVRFLFGGGNPAMRPIMLEFYDDSAGTDTPGSELTAPLMFMIESSDTTLQDIDVSAEHIMVPQQFRVGILFQVANTPSIARDSDGIHLDTNFALVSGVWSQAQSQGIKGDWVLRVVVSGSPPAADTTGSDAGTGSCTTNPDCPLGQYCNLEQHACTFDCRSDDDCATRCSSLGMCVVEADTGGGGGCCQTNRSDGRAPVVAGVIWLWLVVLRRHGRRSQP